MNLRVKQIVAGVLCLIIFLPLLPFAALRVLLKVIVDVIDWAFDDRWLMRTLNELSEKTYKKLIPKEK